MSTARIPDGTPGPDLTSVHTEYGLLYSGGSVLVRPDHLDARQLDPWIKARQREGRVVLRRVVHVIEEWEQVT